MNTDNDFSCVFTKDGDRTITYLHSSDNTMTFTVEGYHEKDNTITVSGAETMNLLMNLLSTGGWDSIATI